MPEICYFSAPKQKKKVVTQQEGKIDQGNDGPVKKIPSMTWMNLTIWCSYASLHAQSLLSVKHEATKKGKKYLCSHINKFISGLMPNKKVSPNLQCAKRKKRGSIRAYYAEEEKVKLTRFWNERVERVIIFLLMFLGEWIADIRRTWENFFSALKTQNFGHICAWNASLIRSWMGTTKWQSF